MKTICIIIFIFLTGITHAGPVSNRLPFELTRELISKGLWSEKYDNSSKENQSINSFLDGLEGDKISSAKVVDNIFGENFSYSQFNHTYKLKVLILRHLREVNNDNYSVAKINEVNKLFVLRFVESILSLVNLSKIDEFQEISDNFIKKVNNNEIMLLDLSPKLRRKLVAESNIHSNTFNEKSDGIYNVSGAFMPYENIFVIDLAGESFEQTIITFVHEMIHAASPSIEIAQKDFLDLLPEATKILKKWSGDVEVLKSVNSKFIKSIFFENTSEEISNLFYDENEKRLKKLSEVVDTSSLPDHEVLVVNSWLKAGLELTVFNEYHAYGLSLSFLSELIYDFKVIKGDINRHKTLIENFSYGDMGFVAKLASSFDPFSNMKVYSFRYRGDSEKYEAFKKLVYYLEFLYLKNIKDIFNKSNKDYSSLLKDILRSSSNFDEYKQMISFDSDMNPFEKINSRVTGANIAKIENNIEVVSRHLKSLITILNTSKLGILDLSNISSAELKLLGIQWQDSIYEHNENGLSLEYYDHLTSVDTDILKHFDLVAWNKSDVMRQDQRVYVDGEHVNSDLLKLRLLKMSRWLSNIFEPWTNSLLGARVYYEKLNSELYFDENELSIDRAQDFEDIIVKILNKSNKDYDSLNKVSLLFDDLSKLYSLVGDNDIPLIRSELDAFMSTIKRALERMGVNGDNNKKDNLKELSDERKAFKSSMEFYKKYCNGVNFENLGAKGIDGGREKFKINNDEFHLMFTCYNNQAYAVRQPSDFTDYMTTSFSFDGSLVAKIFKGSRKIKLKPLIYDPKKSKKKSFFNFFSN